MTRVRTAVLLALATALVAAPATAATGTTTYALPGDRVYPEGVAAVGSTFYVTSTTDGTVFRGSTSRPRAEVLLPAGGDGRTSAVGLDARGPRLVVAGGATGRVFAYDRASGAFRGSFSNGRTGQSQTFLNDVAIAPDGAAYITDSVQPVLYQLHATRTVTTGAEDQPLPVHVDFRGTAFEYVAGFNANGVVVSQDGRYALVVQSATGKLFRVDLARKAVRQVDLGGATLVNGDGLELVGDVLHVVRNRNGVITKVKMARDLSSGRVYGQITDSTFRYPTTAAVAGDRLLVVNSQFDVRSAGGTPAPFTVSGLRR